MDIYRCTRHGLLMLPPDERIRPLPQLCGPEVATMTKQPILRGV